MKLYVIRHGLTKCNVEKKYNGRYDEDIIEEGINQAIKAIAICRGFVAPTGDNLVVIPAFNDIVINGEQKTAIKLIVENK